MHRGLAAFLLSMVLTVPEFKTVQTTTPQRIRVTCYTAKEGKHTASGEEVRKGIVAVKREWMQANEKIALFRCNKDGSKGELIGIFDCKDTGYGKTESNGKGSIQNGHVIDVFQPTLKECYAWIKEYGDYCYFSRISEVNE